MLHRVMQQHLVFLTAFLFPFLPCALQVPFPALSGMGKLRGEEIIGTGTVTCPLFIRETSLQQTLPERAPYFHCNMGQTEQLLVQVVVGR